MPAKNDVICRDEIEKCKSSLRKDVSLAIQQINELSSSVLLEDCLHNIGWNDSFRALLVGLQNSDSNTNARSAFVSYVKCSRRSRKTLVTI